MEDLVPLLPPTAYQAVTVGATTYWTFTRVGRRAGLGKVPLGVSFEKAELRGTSAVVVTTRVDWQAHRIIPRYWHRWPLATCYQDGKTSVGVDADRMRNAEASGNPWGLGFVAYSFLPLDCLPQSPTQGRLASTTLGEACRQQAQALMAALSLYAQERRQLGQRAHDIFAYLFAKQQPVLAR